ncbi:MAG: protein kinase [Planctomycetota bacterium]
MPQTVWVTLSAGSGVRRFELVPEQRLVLGRGAQADLTVNAARISRQHCALFFSQNQVWVEDLRSANGTYLNGRPITRAPVNPGDVIAVGGVGIRADYEPPVEVELTRAERMLAEVLQHDGYRIGRKNPLSTELVPVFHAVSPRGQRVLVKALPLVAGIPEKKVVRFQNEVRARSKLRHPGVIELLDVQRRPQALYLVMQDVGGPLLLDVIVRQGRLPLPLGLRIGLEVVQALKAAHAEGIVHRDLKPGGILLTSDGHPKIADFGIAKDLWNLTGHMTGPEESLGTVHYMPPEQVTGAKHADHRADFYAFGATLYHMLRGEVPFAELKGMQLMQRVLRGEVEAFRVAGLPPEVGAVVSRCMAVKPEDRFSSAEQLEVALSRAAQPFVDVQGFADPGLGLAGPKQGAESTLRGLDRRQISVKNFETQRELLEMVQTIAFQGRTGTLAIQGEGASGHMILGQGRVQSAATEQGKRDRPAALSLLKNDSGAMNFTPDFPEDFQPELDLDLAELVLAASKR